MQKKLLNGYFHWSSREKLKMLMKLGSLLMFLIIFGLQTSAKSQGTKMFSKNFINTSVEEVFKQIQEDSDFRFVYMSNDVKSLKKVTRNFINSTVNDIVDYCLEGSEFGYEMDENTIIIHPREQYSSNKQTTNVPNSMEQEKIVVKGKINDKDGQSLPGATVLEKGTLNGVTTDFDGNFIITLVGTNPTLLFSFIGFEAQEVLVGNQRTINITLNPELSDLDEIVIVAYGTQKVKNLISSIAKVKSEDIEKITSVGLEGALQGQTAGVEMSSGSRAGEVSAIRIRGTSSISASSQPLYVVDGVPQGDYVMGGAGLFAQESPINTINPGDIESIQILKDASASALYGSRASNGVILITTKRGIQGKTKVDFDYSLGFQRPTHLTEPLSGSEYTELFNEAHHNTFGSTNILGDPAEAINTDWLKGLIRDGAIKKLNLSASGGSEKTNFYLGLSSLDDEGYTKGNDFNRLTFRLNLDHALSESVKVGANFNLSRSFSNRVSNGDGINSVTTSGVLAYPNIPIYGDGSALYGENGVFYLGDGTNPFHSVAYNLYNELEQNILESKTLRPSVTAYGEVVFLKDFKFRTEVGYDFIDMSQIFFWGINSGTGRGDHGNGTFYNFKKENYLTTNTLNYSKILKDVHSFNVLLGYSFESTKYDNSTVQGKNFPDNSLYTLANAAEVSQGVTSITNNAIESYFFRLVYNYQSKYLLELSLRKDGSSRFGANNKYATFPAAALGWIVSDENFLKDSKTISLLKLRASYGLTGNAEFLTAAKDPDARGNDFPSRGLYATGVNYNGLPGIFPSQIENPNLKWEKTAQFDIGVNLGLFNDRIALEADYYYKKTKDLLLSFELPSTSGYLSYNDNIGELENKGFEFSLNTRNFVGEFKWNTTINLAFNKNKVTKLENQIIANGISQAREGEPIGVFYTVKFAGVDPQTGDALYYDLEGNKTTVYSDQNRMIVGDPNPDYTGGISNTFSYKGMDLSILVQFVQGNERYWSGGQYYANSMSLFFNNDKSQLARWQNPGDITDVPRAQLFTTLTNPSSKYVVDGSYVRVKNISFGYNVPNKLLKNKLRSARLFITAQNWFTFTNYPGHDPEVSTNGTVNVGQGVDFFVAPPSRSIIFGVKIGI